MKHYPIFLPVLIIAGLLAFCELESMPGYSLIIKQSGEGIFNVSGHDTTDQSSGLSAEILLDLVNTQRLSGRRCGFEDMPQVPPLRWSDQIAAIAKSHSDDMYNNKFLSHTGSDGSNPGYRLRREGLQWRVYGENLARGYQDEEEVIRGWLISPDHCRNIMDANVTVMGIGRTADYWTQLLVLPR